MLQNIIFLVDVDNTLLNNDLVKQQIKKSLAGVLGAAEAAHFWQHHDEFRSYQKLVDFPAITRQYCSEQHSDRCEILVGDIFTEIRFADALYPKALHVLQHLKTLGTVLIFSEGDMVYQKLKIEQSGIAGTADGVLLFTHKLDHLPEIIKQYQSSHLVFIDDRDDKLMEIKKQAPEAITIVVCQGHYAKPGCLMEHSADRVLGSVADLLKLTAEQLL
ncbi:MAG: hypothetical protein HYY51_01725 [Candidatus Magasanikbacteria bacterium]|nr:hypothetical protein [Candidatus Magasanikbacteria bacterium]